MTFHKIAEEWFQPVETWYKLKVDTINDHLLSEMGIISFLKIANGNIIYTIPTLYKEPITRPDNHPRLTKEIKYQYSIRQPKLPTIELETLDGMKLILNRRQREDMLHLLNDYDEMTECAGWTFSPGFFGIFGCEKDCSGIERSIEYIPKSLKGIVEGIIQVK